MPTDSSTPANAQTDIQLAESYYRRRLAEQAGAFDASDRRAIEEALGRQLNPAEAESLSRWEAADLLVRVVELAHRTILPLKRDPRQTPAEVAADCEMLHRYGAIHNGKPMSAAEALTRFATALGGGVAPKRTEYRHRNGRTTYKLEPQTRRLVAVGSVAGPRRGRSARAATNSRSRGSRRATSRSTGGGSSGDPDGDEPPPVGRLAAPFRTGRLGHVNRPLRDLLRSIGEWR